MALITPQTAAVVASVYMVIRLMERVAPQVASLAIVVFVIVCLSFLAHLASRNNHTW